MITFTCPGCGSSFQVKDEFAGRKTTCRKCGGPVLVPFASIFHQPNVLHSTAGSDPRQPLSTDPQTRNSGSWAPHASQSTQSGLFNKWQWLLANLAPLVLAALAFIMALIALTIVLFRDPLGAGLANYDFSSPKAALISQMKIELNKDFRAMLELQGRTKDAKLREALDSLEVRKEAEFHGKKILFTIVKENGVNKYETQSFEKHADTGLWVPVYVGSFDVEKDDKDLADQMEHWEKTGELK